MRTIKFRGKRTNGKWKESESIVRRLDGRVILGGYVINPSTVGQFTGLFDKNGMEIYEGDIVQYIGNGLGDEFETEVKFEGAGFDPIAAIYWMSDIEGVGCEIIGNIHDNPELLKGGNNGWQTIL